MPPEPSLPAAGRKTSPWRVLVLASLPGLLAGTQIAGLLFFLNPHLPFEPLPVLRGVAFYGLLLAGLSALILFFPIWTSPSRAGRILPAALTTVLALAAVAAWVHASQFAFFLPPGINRRLLKAATWLSMAAVVCFYTVLLHLLRRRPYGRRSRALFIVMSLASVYVVLERRDAFKPAVEPSPRETTIEGSQRPRIVVVGIESATLDAILPLAEQENLPFFSRLLKESYLARLAPLRPPRPLPLWTTLATGKYPYHHGIVGKRVYGTSFLGCKESLLLLPLGIGFRDWGVCRPSRAIHAGDRQVLALWEILSRLGVPTGVIGWPLTTPTSPEVQVMISDRFFAEAAGGDEGAASAEVSAAWVVPAELTERARLFRSRREEIDPRILSSFGPEPPNVVVEALREDLWRQDLSFMLLEEQPGLEALFVTLPGLLAVSEHFFGGYSAAQFEAAQDPASRNAALFLSSYYRHLDSYLGRLWESIRGPRLMVVVSVHGSDTPSGWTRLWQEVFRVSSTAGSFRGGPDGVLMCMGEGFRSTKVQSVQLIDVAPTLLYAVGAPLARDLDGAVLADAFTSAFLARRPLTFIPSYEALSVQ